MMNQFWLRTFGLIGVLGGLTLFAGDMLFYYHPDSTNLLENMAVASDERIIVSGLTALLAVWFYLLGLLQVSQAFKPASKLARNLVLASLAAIFVTYGVVHGAYVAIAATAKIALENGLDIKEATHLASRANNALRLMAYPIFGFVSILFIYQVWKRKTHYPRWIILFFPLLPFFLQGLLAKLLSGKAWVIVMGGYLNLLLVVFFLASTIALWNVRAERVKEKME